MKILAIESSCDETAAAVIEDGRKICSNIINSQAEEHALYGGVVPEIASRGHIEAISGVARAAVREAGMEFAEVDAIAATSTDSHDKPVEDVVISSIEISEYKK